MKRTFALIALMTLVIAFGAPPLFHSGQLGAFAGQGDDGSEVVEAAAAEGRDLVLIPTPVAEPVVRMKAPGMANAAPYATLTNIGFDDRLVMQAYVSAYTNNGLMFSVTRLGNTSEFPSTITGFLSGTNMRFYVGSIPTQHDNTLYVVRVRPTSSATWTSSAGCVTDLSAGRCSDFWTMQGDYFAGGEVPPETPPPGGDLEPLQLVKFESNRITVQEGEWYYVTVSIRNPSAVDRTVRVILDEGLVDPGTFADGIDKRYQASVELRIPAGQTRSHDFGPIRHKFMWIQLGNCNLAKAALGPAISYFLGLVNESASAGYDVLTGLINTVKVAGSIKDYRRYSYGFTVQGDRIDRNLWTYTSVTVPRWKRAQAGASMGLDFMWSGFTGFGLAARKKAPAAAYASFLAEAFTYVAMCQLRRSALDPDPAYQQIAEPSELPALAAEIPHDLQGEYLLAWLKFQTDLTPMNDSLHRFEGAKEAGDEYWETQQLLAARRYAMVVLNDLAVLEDLTRRYPEPVGLQPLSDEEMAFAISEMQTSGIPQVELDYMRDQGLTEEEIQSMATRFAETLPYSNQMASSEEKILLFMQNSYLEMVQSLNEELVARSVEALDVTMPETLVSFEATQGLNSWVTSAPVFALSGSDDSACIAGIEYSLDHGTNWQAYQQPVVAAGQGEVTLLARATDCAGNVEFPAVSSTVHVDTRSPEVSVWYEPEGTVTRLSEVVVHCEAVDLLPGSGLADDTCVFNGASVEDEQLVSLIDLPVGSYELVGTAHDVAGLSGSATVSIEVAATLDSVNTWVKLICSNGTIAHAGTCRSLQQKLDAALQAKSRGHYTTAINILKAMQSEIKAQSRSGRIPGIVAELLLGDLDYIIRDMSQ